MTKIRYQLIDKQIDAEVEVLGISEETAFQRVLRVFLACAVVLLIVCYNWPINMNVSYEELQNQAQLINNYTEISVTEGLRSAEVDEFFYISSTNEPITQVVDDFKSSENSITNAASTESLISSKTLSTTNFPITQGLEVFTSTKTHRSSSEDATTQRSFELTTVRINATTAKVPQIDPKILDKYYVYSTGCHMPALNPFAKDAMKISKKWPFKICDKNKDMITVNYDVKERLYRLHINDENSRCCYKPVVRAGSGAQADNKYNLLSCSNFHQDFVVPQHVDAVITECKNATSSKVLQTDAFAFIQGSLGNLTTDAKKPSVLLWGIDSLSRMNFQRTMPLMHKYLEEQHWYELRGYNKMGDNTYPNLMAILTGYNSTRSYKACRPTMVGGLDACEFLWKNYKEHGYVTAYAEDWAKFSTFNYIKKGFKNQPTDYYLRPLVLALEKELKMEKISNMPFCIGRRHYAEYIYDYALEFTKRYKNQANFGMFWTNSFSHNVFSLPSSMDARMVQYMLTLDSNGIMENSIIIFFSDHGMRYGPLRKLESGFVEERLPMFYMRLPKWLRTKYPQFVRALERNRNRLTSPYDIYATLKHILELDTPQQELPKAEGCASCHSVFFDMSDTRDCEAAGIEEHWCTCSIFNKIATTDATVKQITQQLVDATNVYLADKNMTKQCSKLKIHKIASAQLKEQLDQSSHLHSYLIKYEVLPKKAVFEATAVWNNSTRRITIDVDDISRLNKYENDSKCISDKNAKKYCICSK